MSNLKNILYLELICCNEWKQLFAATLVPVQVVGLGTLILPGTGPSKYELITIKLCEIKRNPPSFVAMVFFSIELAAVQGFVLSLSL